jgi:hypothetical protein
MSDSEKIRGEPKIHLSYGRPLRYQRAGKQRLLAFNKAAEEYWRSGIKVNV